MISTGSLTRELSAWGRLVASGVRAAWPGRDDAALRRRGLFLKELAQRLGFAETYWNRAERGRW